MIWFAVILDIALCWNVKLVSASVKQNILRNVIQDPPKSENLLEQLIVLLI